MTRLKRSVVFRRARSAAAMLGFGLLGTVLLGDAAMAKHVLAAEIDAAAPLTGSLPASPPPAQVPGAQVPGAQVPAAQVPGAQVPVSEADFSSPAFSGDQAGDAAATLPDGSTGSEALGDSRSSGGTGDGTGGAGNALSDRLFGLRPASPQSLPQPQGQPIAGSGGAQQVLSSGALSVMSYPVMSDTDIAAQLIPGRPDQLELLANLRLPLGMNTAAILAAPRFAATAPVDENGSDAAAADRPHDAAIIARVPLPAALPLFGGALLALALVNWRGRRRARADRTARYRSAAT